MRYQSDNSNYIPVLEGLVRAGKGTGFVILMEHPGKNKKYKDYSIHLRYAQPCQGGEMRKYSSSHPDRCTQPHNSRPTDLSTPFPDGKPSAVGFWLKPGDDDQKKLYEAVFKSNDSPWRAGFGGEKNVHLFDGGFIIKRLNIDPTVMVNGLNFWNNNSSQGKNFVALMNEGLEANEALAVIMLNGGAGLTAIGSTMDYYFPSRFSARRFFGQKPADLSGGLYEDGADYNRTSVQDVFASAKGLVWQNEMKKILSSLGVVMKPGSYLLTITPSELAKAAKLFFQKGFESETEGEIDVPYVYRDATGQEKPLPDYALVVNPRLAKLKKEKAA